MWEKALVEAGLAVAMVRGTDTTELGMDRFYRRMDRFDRRMGRSYR